MGVKRIVSTDFWLDDKVVDVFTPEDKLFFLYLMTNPHTTQLGIYKLNKKVAAFEIGYSTESVSALINRFEKKYGVIRYSENTSEVAVKNYLKYSIVKGGKPVEDLLTRELKEVKDKSLVQWVFGNIYQDENLNETVRSIINTYFENSNVNGNDNDNDDSYHESCDDSYNDSSKKKSRRFIPPTIAEVSSYCKESGYSVDAQRFVDFYSSKGWMVGKNKMKDWRAAVRGWATRDKQEHVESSPSGWALEAIESYKRREENQ